jgi:serine protease
LLLGVGLHKYLILASAAPVLALTGMFFGVKRLRPLVGGVALGTAALLAQMAFSGETAFVGGLLAMRVWTVVNALVCVWIARLALDKK